MSPAADAVVEANISERQLKGAPKFSTQENWDWNDRSNAIDSYYNVPPY